MAVFIFTTVAFVAVVFFFGVTALLLTGGLAVLGLVLFSLLAEALVTAVFFLTVFFARLLAFPRAALPLLEAVACFVGLETFLGKALAVDLRATTRGVFDFVAFRWLPDLVTMQYTHPFEFTKLYFISNLRIFYKILHLSLLRAHDLPHNIISFVNIVSALPK
jgi:hypothetical protein